MWRQRLQPAHQHVEQTFPRWFFGHVAQICGEHGAIGGLDMGGEDRERRSKFAPQLRQRDAGLGGDVGKADRLEGLSSRSASKAAMILSRSLVGVGAARGAGGGAARADLPAVLRVGLRAMAELLNTRD